MSRAQVKAAMEQAPAFEMPDPEPLVAEVAPRPYPIEALPPLLRDAVTSYQAYGQQPLALVACSALAVASLATQALADVARDPGLSGPISLNLLVVAQSGERKTSADRRLAQAARLWETDKRAALEPELVLARAASAAHTAKRDGLLAKIKRAASNRTPPDPAEMESWQERLEELEMNPPHTPVPPTLFHEDATPEKLGESLARGWPSSSVWSDEGGIFVGSHGMRDESLMRYLGLLNRMWDGQPYARERSTAPSFVIQGRRLTCSLMMQRPVLLRLLDAAGGLSRGMGFLARFLIAWPASTMGTRLYREGDLDGPALTAFDRRIRALFDMPLPVEAADMRLRPPVLRLSPAARARWVEYHDDVEQELGRLGAFADVADFAAKSAENAARLAAIFHLLEHGPAGEISVGHMIAGAQIAAWHVFEARRIIGAVGIAEDVSDAQLLLDWLRLRRLDRIGRREILHSGPSALRQRQRRDRAIAVLTETHHAAEAALEGRTVLCLNPKLGAER